MRFLQTDFSAGAGNALQACVASIFQVPTLADVPNFLKAEEGYAESLRIWAEAQGYTFTKYQLGDGGLLTLNVEPHTEVIVRGTSPRGDFGHVVVGEVQEDGLSITQTHDPHPDGRMLRTPLVWAGVFVPLRPQPERPLTMAVMLFPGVELLDVALPLELFGGCPELLDVRCVGVANEVSSFPTSALGSAGPSLFAPYMLAESGTAIARPVHDLAEIATAWRPDIILVPGGRGARREVENETMLVWLRDACGEASQILSVCTGSALLARAGVLDGHRATSNKAALRWVRSQSAAVEWVDRARWVRSGKFWTSSGVSAGGDLALAFVGDLGGRLKALSVARRAEYRWCEDADSDPFACRAEENESRAAGDRELMERSTDLTD